MIKSKKNRIEFGDFQTPDDLATEICARLSKMGIEPDIIIEPTCGRGSFVLASAKAFPKTSEILGFDINGKYIDEVKRRLPEVPKPNRVALEQLDFFSTDWSEKIGKLSGSILVIGNFPWVTNATQGLIGGSNLPEKSNFLKHNGFDAISGKANFDISEWMLLEVFRWFEGRGGDIAMLVKTAVARKVLAHAERQGISTRESFIIGIDAKKNFGASVDACLLVIRITNSLQKPIHDYTVYESLDSICGTRVGHRKGLTVGNIDDFEKYSYLVGESPQKWRSGVKHDASAIMEFTLTDRGLVNGIGEVAQLESEYLFPLMKGSDIGSNKPWRKKYVLVTQRYVGESTDVIQKKAPMTWRYLQNHAKQLDARGSTIYAKNPRFSVFGVGEYAFRPWKIAICGLYKNLDFRLIAPMKNRPVMFDDTVYYLSFDSEQEATDVFDKINDKCSIGLLSSLIFWDEKRPVKTGILNVLDWSKLEISGCAAVA